MPLNINKKQGLSVCFTTGEPQPVGMVWDCKWPSALKKTIMGKLIGQDKWLAQMTGIEHEWACLGIPTDPFISKVGMF